MPNFQAISLARHGQKRWHNNSGYTHAAHEAVAPLVMAEMPKAMLTLPLGFIEESGTYTLVAVLSLLPGKGLFVSQNGSWAGDYIPAVFRGYPFRLARTEEGQQVLCIDEESGLISDGPSGERFFNEDETPAKSVLDILGFLNSVEQNRVQTMAACAALQKHNLIRPWGITLKTESGEQAINGLFQIDEAALNQLPAEALFEVRNAGGLSVAYCQMLSMQHLPLLGQMIEAHGKAAAQSQSALQQLGPGGELDIEFLNKGGTFNFAGMF